MHATHKKTLPMTGRAKKGEAHWRGSTPPSLPREPGEARSDQSFTLMLKNTWRGAPAISVWL